MCSVYPSSISSHAQLLVSLHIQGECSLPIESKSAFCRIAQEAVSYIAYPTEASIAVISLRNAGDAA
jgi:signal transduction histidine kinase